MHKPCKFPSLDSCWKRFLWTDKEAEFAPHSVIGLVLKVGDVEKFPQALGFKSLNPLFFSISKQGQCFTAKEEDGGEKRLVKLELACETDSVVPPYPV